MGMISCRSCGIRVCWYSCRGEREAAGWYNGIHDTALTFSSLFPRYGSDLTPDQKDALLDVIRARPHHTISSEIRRELVMSVVRGEPRPEEKVEGDVEMR